MSILYHGTCRPKNEPMDMMLRPHFSAATKGVDYIFATSLLEYAYVHTIKIRDLCIFDTCLTETKQPIPILVLRNREQSLQHLSEMQSSLIKLPATEFTATAKNDYEFTREEDIDFNSEDQFLTDGIEEAMNNGVQVFFYNSNDIDDIQDCIKAFHNLDTLRLLKTVVENATFQWENQLRGINPNLG